MKHTPLSYIFTLVTQYLINLKTYIQSISDELSDDIKKKFILPLTIELQDHKEKVFYNTPLYHTVELILSKMIYFSNDTATNRSEAL